MNGDIYLQQLEAEYDPDEPAKSPLDLCQEAWARIADLERELNKRGSRIEALEAERDMLRQRLDECGCEHLRNLVSGPLDVVDGLMWVVSALDGELPAAATGRHQRRGHRMPVRRVLTRTVPSPPGLGGGGV